MKGLLRWTILGWVLLVTVGCGSLAGYLAIPREQATDRSYGEVLNRWTRTQIVYAQFETKVQITATFRNEVFKAAYLEEEAKSRQWRTEEKEKRRARIASESGEVAEFLFYAYVPEKPFNDFDRHGSIWTVFLVDAKGKRIDPMEIRRVDPVSPVVTAFFPYINPHYGIAYHLRFPPLNEKERKDGAVRLVFASVLGKIELDFRSR